MSSLSGAPALGSKPKSVFQYEPNFDDPIDEDDEDNLFPSDSQQHRSQPAASTTVISLPGSRPPLPKASSATTVAKVDKQAKRDKQYKEDKRDKRDKASKRAKSSSDDDRAPSSSSAQDAKPVNHAPTSNNVEQDQYAEDFDEDAIPEVSGHAERAAAAAAEEARIRAAEAEAARVAEWNRQRAFEAEQARMRAEKERQENEDRLAASAAATDSHVQHQLVAQPAITAKAYDPPATMHTMTTDQLQTVLTPQLLQQLLAAQQQNQQTTVSSLQQQQQQQLLQHGQSKDKDNDGDDDQHGNKERERRRRREYERERTLRQLQDEDAAHALFHRLAKDVRDVFHELNLAVVAAEKERLVKDERYRKERDLRDARETQDRLQRDDAERKAREEREEKFLRTLDDRDEKFRVALEARLRRDEEDRDDRAKRDAEERTQRAKSDRDLREDYDRLERERREKEDNAARERDRNMLGSQIEEVKKQYRTQMEELRRQFDNDRAHLQEMHKLEMQAAEVRHSESAATAERYHADQMTIMEMHSSNAKKLEEMLHQAQTEIGAARLMHEKLAQDRINALRDRENQAEKQHEVIKRMQSDMEETKAHMERERMRVTQLYAQFEVSLQQFVRENEEERRKYRDSQAHVETLRQSIEKDRRGMLQEMHTERKLLEQQHNEFIDRKLQMMNELQVERQETARERTQWNLVKEQHNRDEATLLAKLRAREEELAMKIEQLESDRQFIADSKREAIRLREESKYERDNIAQERAALETEQLQIMERVKEVQRRADEAVEVQMRLRRGIVEEKMSERFADPYNPGALVPLSQNRMPSPNRMLMPSAVSSFHLDLARQRAVLNRLGGQ